MADESADPVGESQPDVSTQASSPESVVDASSRAIPEKLVPYKTTRGCGATWIELDMAKRNVTLPLLSTLSDYVAQLHTPLVKLTLSRNALGSNGAALLGNSLITNNTLQFLELEQCELIGSSYRPQHDGIKALAKGFESARSTLRFISVANNALQPEGCRILLGALSFHSTLTALDISSNLLSSFNEKQGYLALSYVIQYSKQLCWLAINDNMLPPPSWRVLQASLAGNTTLTSLSALHCGATIDQLRAASATVLTDLQC